MKIKFLFIFREEILVFTWLKNNSLQTSTFKPSEIQKDRKIKSKLINMQINVK